MLRLEVDQDFIDKLLSQITEQITKELSAKYAVAAKWPPMLDYKDIMKFFHCQPAKAFDIMRIADLPRVGGVGSKSVPIWMLIDWIDSHADYNINHYNYGTDK